MNSPILEVGVICVITWFSIYRVHISRTRSFDVSAIEIFNSLFSFVGNCRTTLRRSQLQILSERVRGEDSIANIPLYYSLARVLAEAPYMRGKRCLLECVQEKLFIAIFDSPIKIPLLTFLDFVSCEKTQVGRLLYVAD